MFWLFCCLRFLEIHPTFEYSMCMDDPKQRIQELEEQIAELKARWPAHSVQPWMLQQLEDLEAELEQLKQEEQDE